MSGLVLRVKVSLLFGHLLLKTLLMLEVRGLVSSACAVLPLLFLQWLLLSLSLFLIVGVLSGVCFLLRLVGSCIFLFYMVIRVLILILSSYL